MAIRRDIDALLKKWDFRPGEVIARLVKARDGREVLQMRVDMGLLQMETDLRPDGLRPHGAETYYDYLVGEVIREGGDFRLSKEQCAEADREFVQYYHRRSTRPTRSGRSRTSSTGRSCSSTACRRPPWPPSRRAAPSGRSPRSTRA